MSEPDDFDFSDADSRKSGEKKPLTDEDLLRAALQEQGKKLGELEELVERLMSTVGQQGRLLEACRRMVRRLARWAKSKG